MKAIVCQEYDTEILEEQVEAQADDFKFTKVRDNEVFFSFDIPAKELYKLRAMLRIIAGMDSPLNRELNMVIEGNVRWDAVKGDWQ